jgi:hypothetical protein
MIAYNCPMQSKRLLKICITLKIELVQSFFIVVLELSSAPEEPDASDAYA